MAEFFTSWLSGIAGAAVITSILMALLPDGGPKRIAGMACACVMAAAVLLPISGCDADIGKFSAATDEYSKRLEARIDEFLKENEELQKKLTKESTESMLVSAAKELGIFNVRTEVIFAINERNELYPYKADIYYSEKPSEQGKSRLVSWISANLAIPVSRQRHIVER